MCNHVAFTRGKQERVSMSEKELPPRDRGQSDIIDRGDKRGKECGK